MTSGKLSVITFFGILVPGAYLAGILVMAVASAGELCGLPAHQGVFDFVSGNTGLFAGVFLFVAYFLGVLIRMFAPGYVDRLSTLYLVHVLRDKRDWAADLFPYGDTLSSCLRRSGMGSVPELMSSLNSRFGETGNKEFFNYCKWFIDANDPALSRQVQEAEALVRFLSGTTFALLAALPLTLSFFLVFAIHGAEISSAVYGALLAIDTVCLALILRRFKHQRRREVLAVWSSVHLIANGGTPATVAQDRKRLCESVFFSAGAAATDPPGAVGEGPQVAPGATTEEVNRVFEYVAVVRQMIQHEDMLVNQRLGWLFALQGLLFAASSFFWNISLWPVVTIGCVGLLACVSVGYTLGRAITAIGELLQKAREAKESLPEAARQEVPPTIGARSKAVRRLLPAVLLPWVIGAAWIAMLLLRLRGAC